MNTADEPGARVRDRSRTNSSSMPPSLLLSRPASAAPAAPSPAPSSGRSKQLPRKVPQNAPSAAAWSDPLRLAYMEILPSASREQYSRSSSTSRRCLLSWLMASTTCSACSGVGYVITMSSLGMPRRLFFAPPPALRRTGAGTEQNLEASADSSPPLLEPPAAGGQDRGVDPIAGPELLQ